MPTMEDYRNAPSGVGPLADEWKDKPHRLVYDLAKLVGAERARLDFATEQLSIIAGYGLDVAPGMDAETSYRLSAGDCIRRASYALRVIKDGDAARAPSTPSASTGEPS